MREYSKVAPQFWNGKTGKALKAQGTEAVIVALYLMTCQHANMLGLYYLNKAYIAVDTGLGFEGASKGLAGACEAGFCAYDEASEVVWVIEMAAYQIGEQLDAKDNRCKGIQREYESLPDNPFLPMFFQRYADSFCMQQERNADKPPASPLKAPPKPRARAGAGERAGTRAGLAADAADASADATADNKRGSRLPTDWALPNAWGQWALAKHPHWTADTVRAVALKFRNHWIAKVGKDASKLDWLATWQNWCDSGITQKDHPAPKTAGGIDRDARDAEAMALLGITNTHTVEALHD